MVKNRTAEAMREGNDKERHKSMNMKKVSSQIREFFSIGYTGVLVQYEQYNSNMSKVIEELDELELLDADEIKSLIPLKW
jgi:hypothetical protein